MIAQWQEPAIHPRWTASTAVPVARRSRDSVESDLVAPDNAHSFLGGPGEGRQVSPWHHPKDAGGLTEGEISDELSAVSGPALGLHGSSRRTDSEIRA